jgi:hypothetical protein
MFMVVPGSECDSVSVNHLKWLNILFQWLLQKTGSVLCGNAISIQPRPPCRPWYERLTDIVHDPEQQTSVNLSGFSDEPNDRHVTPVPKVGKLAGFA